MKKSLMIFLLVALAAVFAVNTDTNAQALKMSQGFEGAAFPPAGWTTYNVLGPNVWSIGTTAIIALFPPFPNGVKCAAIDYQTTGGDDWLVTKKVSGIVAGDSLIFWWVKRYSDGPYPPDSCIVRVSTTDSMMTSFTNVLLRINVAGTPIGTQVWNRVTLPLTTFAGQNIFVAFQHKDTDGHGMGIDSVTVVGPNAPTTPVWVAQTSGVTTSLNCVSTVSDNGGWIGGNGGVILQTTNGGTNWVSKANAVVGVNDVYAICGISASVCLVSTSPAATFVYRTADGGTTWTQVFTQTGGFIDDIRMKDATTGFMYGDPVGGRWSLWKTVNAGLTWDSTGLYLPQVAAEAGWNNAMFMQGNNIWFGTSNTKVYKSNNFGTSGSWTSGVTTGTANSYSVAFNGLTGFSGTTAAVKSIDAGATYTAVTVPGAGTLYSFNSILNTNRFWYNRANIIYASTNNGANFAAQYTGTVGATFQAMHIILSGTTLRGWSVSNTGLIAMFDQQNVIITNVTLISTTAPETFSLSQNYPNPFNPTTKINFALPKSGLVTLKVYDILGKEVSTLINGVQTAGVYNYEFNASNLSSGVYFYKLQSGEFTAVKRMMLVK